MKEKFEELKFTKLNCLQKENEITFKAGSPYQENDNFGIRIRKCAGSSCANDLSSFIQKLVVTVFVQKEEIDFSVFGSNPVLWSFSVITEFRIRPFYKKT
jgi:hypothetical protein